MALEAGRAKLAEEPVAPVASLMVADLVGHAPESRMLRDRQEQAATGSHAAHQVLERAIVIRNVLEDIEAADDVERARRDRIEDCRSTQPRARRAQGRDPERFLVGIAAGEIERRMVPRKSGQYEPSPAADLAEASRVGEVAGERPRDEAPAFFEPEMARLPPRQTVEGCSVEGLRFGSQASHCIGARGTS